MMTNEVKKTREELLRDLQDEFELKYGTRLEYGPIEQSEVGDWMANFQTRDGSFLVKGAGKTQEDAIKDAFIRAEKVLERRPLLLNSLAIANFRAFSKLQINRLGQMNLVVGKNNIGKTCLLEALWLYASVGSPEVIKQILTARNELAVRRADESQISMLKHLFYGRKSIETVEPQHIFIGSLEDRQSSRFGFSQGAPAVDKALSLQTLYIEREIVRLIEEVVASEGISQAHSTFRELFTNGKLIPEILNKLGRSRRLSGEKDVILIVRLGSRDKLIISEGFKPIISLDVSETPAVFISSNGLDKTQVARLWDKVYLTDLQDDVEAALRIIESDIVNIGLVTSVEEEGQQVPQARMSGAKERVLLSSLGEGMNRLFGLALALVNAKNGLLLADDISNGIHYSVQAKLWDFIFTQAQRLNVQVFATTHSWDAVEAFQQAAQNHEDVEGLLISLRRKQDSPSEMVGTLFNEADLAYVTREQIEVR